VLFRVGGLLPEFRMVLGQTRKTRAASWALQARRLLISRMRKRWAGVK
jgi:hypothetical protein